MNFEELNERAISFYENKDYENARAIWEENAKSYHAESMYHLGCMYYEGVGVQVDYKKAYEIFTECAKNNDCSKNKFARECLFNAGNAHFNGEGVEKSMEKAFEFYALAADAGHIGCAFNVGYSCYAGRDAGGMFERDFDKAFKYLSIAAEGGMGHAQVMLATLYLAGRGCNQDVSKARYYLKLAAEQGNEQAKEILEKVRQDYGDEDDEVEEDSEDEIDIEEMKKNFKNVETFSDISELAEMDFVNIYNADIITSEEEYDEGLDNLDFENMSNEELEELAIKDNRIALFAVGKFSIDNGEVEKGFRMLSRSAAYKYPPAMFELGMCYIGGVGTKKDSMTGMGYIAKAAKHKDLQANFTLIEYYKKSGKNDRVMELYHMLADELNNVIAQEWLGSIYQRGTYGVKDLEKAKHYLTLSVGNGGDDVAYLNLGIYYVMHENTKEGYKEAEKLFIKAKELGSEYASFYLGHLYKITHDYDRARVELKDAAAKGIKEAQVLLDEINE